MREVWEKKKKDYKPMNKKFVYRNFLKPLCLRIIKKTVYTRRKTIKNINIWVVNSLLINIQISQRWMKVRTMSRIYTMNFWVYQKLISVINHKYKEKIYCDINGKSFSFLNKFLQESLFPWPIMIVITLSCTHDGMKKENNKSIIMSYGAYMV